MSVTTTAIVAREPTGSHTVNWSLEDVDVPQPGESEILVEIYAAGICHTDLLLSSVAEGVYGVSYPKILGHEGAGIVRALGANITSVQPGDPVLLSYYSCSSCKQCKASHPAYCDSFAQANYIGQKSRMSIIGSSENIWSHFFGQSSFARYTVVSEASVVNVKHLIENEDELKLFAPLGCGFQTGMGVILNYAVPGPGDAVMILGLGGVGMGALMTAKIQNCETIIVVDRLEARLQLALDFGATHTINTGKLGSATLIDTVFGIRPGGVSAVIDTTGAPGLIEEAFQCTEKRGKFIFIGASPYGYEFRFDLITHINSGRSIIGCIEGDCIPGKAIPQMIKWYREGRFPIDKLIQYFPAEEHQQALAGLKDGSVIKPVLVWNK